MSIGCGNFYYMKRLFLILFLYTIHLSPVSLCAQTAADTIPFTMDEDELMDHTDSVIFFPTNEINSGGLYSGDLYTSGIYTGWDTTNIHTVKADMKSLNDSVREFALYSDHNCGYVHPFSGRVTSKFGPRKKRYHYGVDIDLIAIVISVVSLVLTLILALYTLLPLA